MSDLGKALDRLAAALATVPADDVRRAGCIQYFEFSFELSWKCIKVVGELAGLADLNSPRSCLRQAFRQGWLEHEEPWLKMLEARNLMAHTYDAERALAVYDLLAGFLVEMRHLLTALSRASAE
ncbi:MAG: nucleotidyltransferase substrate binding protein [Acidobacteria bacterium]|nr:nucleotidyltransferase substrate binding protein [Acidobacteriota bacterium]